MADAKTILVVDDDQLIRESVRLHLQSAGHTVVEAGDGRQALAVYRDTHPDLLLLDIAMPGMSGLDVCRALRQDERSLVPVIVMSANSDTIDKVVALEVGADDYITKPFENREMIARVNAHLRRLEGAISRPPEDVIEHMGLRIDLPRRQCFKHGTEISLTLTEFNLLALLARDRGKVHTRADLLREVWGYSADATIETRTVDAHVYRLRRKIEDNPDTPGYVESVPGVGYRFADRRTANDAA